MHDVLIAQITTQLDALLARYRALEAENHRLKTEADHWQQERQMLIEKNTLACTRIEAMIGRLKKWDLPHEG